jgi:SDR family mycofactocin-dependent oxidoreductase
MPSPGRFAGKVALVTGAARGQGRSHAVRLAEEGADVILLDICADYEVTEYPGATVADLQDTVRQVEMLDRRAVATQVDVRDLDALRVAVDSAVADLGRLDVVVVNAGICVLTAWDEVTPQIWRDTLDTNLTGAWHTLVTTAPHLIAAGGGSVVCTGSTCGVRGVPFFGPYVAAKHGLVGIARTMANELAQYSVRVNVVHPTGVLTDLTDGLSRIGELIERNPTLGQTFQNALPVTRIESADVTNAVLYLASDEARYVTGTELLVDAGNTNF